MANSKSQLFRKKVQWQALPHVTDWDQVPDTFRGLVVFVEEDGTERLFKTIEGIGTLVEVK